MSLLLLFNQPAASSGATLVQTTSVGSADFANASVTFASPVTAGNTLIIYGAVEDFGAPAPALSSNQGDTFVTTSRTIVNVASVLARVDSAVGGSTTITLTGGAYHRLVAQEWSGLTYDSGAGTGTATASGTITASTPNSTTSANSVVFSTWSVRTGENYSAQQVPTGYTEAGRFVATPRAKFIGAHRAETTTGVKSAQWDDPGIFADERSAIIFAFTAASGGGGAITGTLSVTESGSDTLASSGVVVVQGSLAGTESGGDTAALSGVVVVQGTVNATESGSDTLASTGNVIVSGALSVSETGSDTFLATGGSVVIASGDLAATEAGSDTASLSGSVFVQGALSATESGSDTAAFSGDVFVQGALSVSETGSDTFTASGTVSQPAVTGTLNASEQGSDTAEILGPNLAPPSTGGGFVMTGRPSKLWWTRKPKALDDEEADRKVKRVVRVIERIAREQADRNVTQPNKVARAEVRAQIEPLVQEMPGFDWGTVYRALLIQAAQQRQAILAEQARINAEDDEILLLLMG